MCKSCGSDKLGEFNAETCIHFPVPEGLDKNAVFVFPTLIVCFDCGFTEFELGDAELGRLKDSYSYDDPQEPAG
jgi:hypothetical protein